MPAHDAPPPVDPAVDSTRRPLPLRWWLEILLTVAFYAVYSAVRNRFGSALGQSVRDDAYDNARRVIDLERLLGLYREEWLQAQFIGWEPFIVFWNVFYGTFHFVVTIGAMIYLFIRFPARYVVMRSALCATTAVALLGFAFFPLMPPRLLSNCVSRFGMCVPGHAYVDTLVDPGGLWSFESGTMEVISNQYAAMPSLHIGWALWCTVALLPMLRSRWARFSIGAYPILTLFSILVTANHFWIDAIGGVLALLVGLRIAPALTSVLPGGDGTLHHDAARRPLGT